MSPEDTTHGRHSVPVYRVRSKPWVQASHSALEKYTLTDYCRLFLGRSSLPSHFQGPEIPDGGCWSLRAKISFLSSQKSIQQIALWFQKASQTPRVWKYKESLGTGPAPRIVFERHLGGLWEVGKWGRQ
jgi:hypothetical protein